MIEITFEAQDGWRRAVKGRPGETLMEAGVHASVPGIVAECGGACACATCHILIDADWRAIVGPPNFMEDQLLELVSAREIGSRLACQIKLKETLSGLHVRVPVPSEKLGA